MKIAVRYFSKTGNTKAASALIAEAAGCQAESIDTPLEGVVDLLFLGGGVYWGKIPEALKQYMRELKPEMVRHVAVFYTSGIAYEVGSNYRQFLQKHDLKVMQKTFSCLGKHVNEESTARQAVQFVSEIRREWENLERYEGES